MIDQDAPESDIDAYIASEGVSLEELQAPSNAMPTPPLASTVAPTPSDVIPNNNYQAGILPFSKDAQGKTSFDTDAGIIGMAKRAFAAPGDVYTGKLDPTSPEGQSRATEFAAVTTPIGAASRVPGSIFAPKTAYKTVTPKAPTREALQEATTAAYKEVDELDVKYTASAVEKMAKKLENFLNEKGYIAPITGGVHDLIKTLQGAPENAYIKLGSLDAFRKVMGQLAGTGDDTTKAAASEAIRVVDDFISTANPASLVDRAASGGQGVSVAGQSFATADAAANKSLAEKASQLILEARSNAAANFRANKIAELEEVMGLRSAAANSGMNIDNTARSKLVSLLTNSGGTGVRGFNDTEKAAIKNIIMGTPTKNALRRVGNMLGGGGGLGQTITTFAPATTAGLATGSPMAAIAAGVPGIVGSLSKSASNKMAKNELNQLSELIRSRSQLGNKTMGPQQVYAPNVAQETMLKALIAHQAGDTTQPSAEPLVIDNIRPMNRALGAR